MIVSYVLTDVVIKFVVEIEKLRRFCVALNV